MSHLKNSRQHGQPHQNQVLIAKSKNGKMRPNTMDLLSQNTEQTANGEVNVKRLQGKPSSSKEQKTKKPCTNITT